MSSAYQHRAREKAAGHRPAASQSSEADIAAAEHIDGTCNGLTGTSSCSNDSPYLKAKDFAYWSTADLCARFRCSSRTLARWMCRDINPLPRPAIQNHGSQNLWSTQSVLAWEAAEKGRTSSL